MARQRAPVRLKVAGVYFLVIGGLTVVGAVADSEQISRSELVWEAGVGCFVLLGGGLVFNERWAWPIALMIAVAGTGLGLYTIAQPADITMMGAPALGLFLFVVPGLLILIALLTPRSIDWFRRAPT